MAQLSLTSLVIIFLSLFSTLATAGPPIAGPPLARLPIPSHNPQTMTYIKASCQGTLYPNLCIRCLARFANSTIQSPQHLAHVALAVSLSRALQTRGYLLEVAKEFRALQNNRDYLIVQDCLRQINDSVDQLGHSIKELHRLSRIDGAVINDDVLWHISNVETWVSTALTDASTCVDSFPGHRMSKMKAIIRGKALNVAQVTSNALAIFHRYVVKYRAAAAAAKKP